MRAQIEWHRIDNQYYAFIAMPLINRMQARSAVVADLYAAQRTATLLTVQIVQSLGIAIDRRTFRSQNRNILLTYQGHIL